MPLRAAARVPRRREPTAAPSACAAARAVQTDDHADRLGLHRFPLSAGAQLGSGPAQPTARPCPARPHAGVVADIRRHSNRNRTIKQLGEMPIGRSRRAVSCGPFEARRARGTLEFRRRPARVPLLPANARHLESQRLIRGRHDPRPRDNRDRRFALAARKPAAAAQPESADASGNRRHFRVSAVRVGALLVVGQHDESVADLQRQLRPRRTCRQPGDLAEALPGGHGDGRPESDV